MGYNGGSYGLQQANGGSGRWLYWVGIIILIIAVIVSLFPHSKQAEDLTSTDQHNISRALHLFILAISLILVGLYLCQCNMCQPKCRHPHMVNGVRVGGGLNLPGFTKSPVIRT